MIAKYLALLFFGLVIVSCQKYDPGQPVALPPEYPDTALLKLKDVLVTGLPSPYYHFAYDDSGFVTQAVFSSGLSIYDLNYSARRLSEMDMNKDVASNTKKDKLQFDYRDGEVTAIRVIDKTGFFYRRCVFGYSDTHQLQTMEWDVNIDGSGFLKEEIAQFSYYPDGNLAKMKYQSFAVGPQTAAVYQDRFESYDNKRNADAFALLHLLPNFLDFILLPSVHMQVNNPGRVIHTGDGINYQIDYSYTYDSEGRPIQKNGDFLYIGGKDDGKHVNLQTAFSYYD